LVFLAFRRLLILAASQAKHRDLWSGAAALLFLFHPIQTEAVAYIAGRSETLSALFALGALTIFLYQPLGRCSPPAAVMIVALYGAAVASKEQAAVLPVLFVCTDLLFGAGGLRQALRSRAVLYGSLAAAACVALAGVAFVLSQSTSAGFSLPDLAWYKYFFSQCRVWFLYLRLIIFPVSQNADYDVAISSTLLEHGAIFGLAGMLVLAVLAWIYRKRFPLASYGFIMFALLLAPTSSIVPIQDLAAERRVYLPLLGAILVALEFLRRLEWRTAVTAAVAAVLLLAGAFTYQRGKVWGNSVAFWTDTISKSPNKRRGYTHLVYAYLRERRCVDAQKFLTGLPSRFQTDSELLISWAYTLECLHKPAEAIEKLQRAAAVSPSPGTYLLLGNALQRSGLQDESRKAYNVALHYQPKTPFDRQALQKLMAQ
jgi:tetratricopeptide (TPR) repeat protein